MEWGSRRNACRLAGSCGDWGKAWEAERPREGEGVFLKDLKQFLSYISFFPLNLWVP